MIAEIVSFDLPPGTSQAEALELYRQSAQAWLANPNLIEKYYFFDEARCAGGGIYIWPSQEVAERWHGDEYQRMVRSRYGATPRFQILKTLLHVDPHARTIRGLPR